MSPEGTLGTIAVLTALLIVGVISGIRHWPTTSGKVTTILSGLLLLTLWLLIGFAILVMMLTVMISL